MEELRKGATLDGYRKGKVGRALYHVIHRTIQ